MDNALGNEQALGVSAVKKQKVFTQAILLASAIETALAWRRIGDDNGISFPTANYAGACGGNSTRDFMTKASRCVAIEQRVTPTQCFDIGTAGCSGGHLQQNLTRCRLGDRALLQANIHRRIKHDSKHGYTSTSVTYRCEILQTRYN